MAFDAPFMEHIFRSCVQKDIRTFFEEQLPDGSVIHSFAKRIFVNPVDGTVAIATAVLSITEANEGITYAFIARSLAADYQNIYYVDLDTDRYIEYSAPVSGEDMVMERRGEHFFETMRLSVDKRIYEQDRERLLFDLSKKHIMEEIQRNGAFVTTSRMIDTGQPVNVRIKITRMPLGNHIICGLSVIDEAND